MHYKGTGKVHSFRGLIPSGEETKIRIEGAVGAIAWRIVKFELMGYKPGDGSEGSYECIAKIARNPVASVSGTVDFTDANILAVGLCFSNTGPHYSEQVYTVFDNDLFNRNIFVSQIDIDAARSLNYYIELEEVKLSSIGMAQLAVAAARRTIG